MRSINETWGSMILHVRINPDTITSDVAVYLKESERGKAANFKEGDHVTFIGILNNWGLFTDTTLEHGEIVE